MGLLEPLWSQLGLFNRFFEQIVPVKRLVHFRRHSGTFGNHVEPVVTEGSKPSSGSKSCEARLGKIPQVPVLSKVQYTKAKAKNSPKTPSKLPT